MPTIILMDDEGNQFLLKGTSEGAALVKTENAYPANNSGSFTANGSAGAIQYDTIGPDETVYVVVNQDATAGDILELGFGEDETAADAALGHEIVMPGERVEIHIPTAAQNGGKVAYRSASANTIDFHASQRI